MDLKRNRLAWYGVTTGIFALLLYFADIPQFIEALNSVNRFYMALALISGLSFFLVIAVVWKRVFETIGIENNYWTSLRLFLGGNFMNSITPLGQFGGEPFMAYIVSRHSGETYQKSLSGVVSADMLNAVPLVTYFILSIVYISIFSAFNSTTLQITYVAVPVIMIGLILGYLVFFRGLLLENLLFDIVDRAEDHLGRGEKYIDSVKEKISEARKAFKTVGDDPVFLLKTMLFPHLAVGLQFMALYFILLGQGVEASLLANVLTVVLSTMATFSPTPGGSGTFETAFSGLLMLFYPVGFDTALASAILFRLTSYWPGIAIGYMALISLRREREKRGQVRAK